MLLKNRLNPWLLKPLLHECSHCTTMKPIFERLEKEFGKKYIFAEFEGLSSNFV